MAKLNEQVQQAFIYYLSKRKITVVVRSLRRAFVNANIEQFSSAVPQSFRGLITLLDKVSCPLPRSSRSSPKGFPDTSGSSGPQGATKLYAFECKPTRAFSLNSTTRNLDRSALLPTGFLPFFH